jgi:phenylpyruvate tautomerase PptA (4-oxalocrotonate tautomerase family)
MGITLLTSSGQSKPRYLSNKFMPVLNIKALPQENPELIQAALKKTSQAIAQAYGCKPEHVWVTWEELKSGFYVEGTNAADMQPAKSHPPIAQLFCFEGKSIEAIEQVLLAAAQTLSAALGIPNNIFITYHECKSGEVIAGNGIIRKSLR